MTKLMHLSRRAFTAGAMIFPLAAKAASPALPGFNVLRRAGILYANGMPLNFESFRGKVLIVNFWAHWCSNCIEEFSSMASMQRAMGGSDKVAVVLVSMKENWAQDQAFAQQFKIPFPLACFDSATSGVSLNDEALMLQGQVEDGSVASTFPLSYFIDSNGDVVGTFVGKRDWMAPPMLNLIKVCEPA